MERCDISTKDKLVPVTKSFGFEKRKILNTTRNKNIEPHEWGKSERNIRWLINKALVAETFILNCKRNAGMKGFNARIACVLFNCTIRTVCPNASVRVIFQYFNEEDFECAITIITDIWV
jgi:hypothetical protein